MVAGLTVAASGILAWAPGPFDMLVLVFIAWGILMIPAMWALLAKAGQPGWAVLIPFYYQYILCKMIDKSGWWVLLMCLPYIGAVFSVIFMIMWCGQVAKDFGRGGGTAVGMFFLPFVFIPMLAFGSAQYGGRTPSSPPPPPVDHE